MEAIRIGGLYDGDTKHQAGSVWDKNNLAPTIDTMQGGYREPMIVEDKTIVAMRGRNPDNPSDRTVGAPTEQRLEHNKQGICNTLTSVQKDNLVMEKVVIDDTYANREPRVYEDYCPTLRSEREGLKTVETISTKGKQIEVASTILAGYERTNMTGFNADNGVVETVRIKQATSQGYIECEVGGVADLSFPESKTRRGRVQEKGQVSPTLMAGEQDICRIKNLIIGGEQKHQAIKKDGVCTCLTSSMGTGGGYVPMIAPQYRIRKLTPRECWRLMDFTDEDFEKAAQVNSNTQLYKQAGNSIVKNVLVAILGQMIPGKENVYKEI